MDPRLLPSSKSATLGRSAAGREFPPYPFYALYHRGGVFGEFPAGGPISGQRGYYGGSNGNNSQSRARSHRLVTSQPAEPIAIIRLEH